MALSTGEVPHDPGVDRAEGEAGVDRDPTLRQQPLVLGGAEIRIEHQSGAPADEVEVAGLGERQAAVGGAPILPHDRPPVRLSRGAITATTVSRWLVMPIAATVAAPTSSSTSVSVA